jgi:hypothetical protein
MGRECELSGYSGRFASWFAFGCVSQLMDRGCAFRIRPTWALIVAGVALLASPIGAAWAETYTVPENKLGYSACLWPAGKVLTVAVDPAFPFPNQSFSDRLDETIARWNGVLASSGRGGGLVRSPGPGADIVVQYRALEGTDTSEVLGETYIMREGDVDFSNNIGRCPDRRPQAFTMRAAQIRVAPRNDWYAAPDGDVPNWQNCGSQTFRATNPVLCAGQVDVASTMTHEFGHALVFYHPETLDDIDQIPTNRSDSASTAAHCVEAAGTFDAQATMCAGQGMWRGEQRSLETWDIETTHREYSQ